MAKVTVPRVTQLVSGFSGFVSCIEGVTALCVTVGGLLWTSMERMF